MKKFVVLLGVVVVGLMTVLTQAEMKDLQKNKYGDEEVKLQLESAFERDETVNKLLEYLVSVNQSEHKSDDSKSNISVNREGGIAEMYLYGIENNTYYEQVEKIERVLGLEGLVDFVYNEAEIEKEKLLLSGIKEEYGSVCRIKYYGQAVVTVSAYKSDTYEEDQFVERDVFIKVPSEKLKDTQYATLAETLMEDGYYVSQLMQGEEKDVLVLVNANSLASSATYSWNEVGEMEPLDLLNIRYEVLTDKAQPEEMRVILESRGKITMNETDKAVLVNVAQEIGLNQEEVERLIQLVDTTLEKPTKNQDQKVGEWQYSSKYTMQENSYNGATHYLEMSLTD